MHGSRFNIDGFLGNEELSVLKATDVNNLFPFINIALSLTLLRPWIFFFFLWHVVHHNRNTAFCFHIMLSVITFTSVGNRQTLSPPHYDLFCVSHLSSCLFSTLSENTRPPLLRCSLSLRASVSYVKNCLTVQTRLTGAVD